MRFTSLKEHLAQDNLYPCYLACGDDAYLVKEATRMFCTLAGDFPEMNVSVFTDSATPQDIISSAKSVPLMSKVRIVCINASQAGGLDAYLKNPCPTTVLLLTDIKDTVKPIKGAEFIDCSRLDPRALTDYIAKNATIAPDAAKLLVDYCCRFMGRITLELQKIVAYANQRKIERADVEKLVRPEQEYKVFELSDTIARKQPKRALELLHDMLEDGAGAWTKVFGLVYSHFRRILYVSLSPSAGEAAAALEINEYAAQMAQKQAAGFTKARLKTLLDMLHKLDADIKGGKATDRIALQVFVLSATQG